MKTKQVNIKKNKYHTININDLDPCLLDIKKSLPKTLIFTTLITFKKISIVVPSRIKINSATGYFKEKNDEKHLNLDSTK